MLALLQAMWFKGSKGTYANKKVMDVLGNLGKRWTNISMNHWAPPPTPLVCQQEIAILELLQATTYIFIPNSIEHHFTFHLRETQTIIGGINVGRFSQFVLSTSCLNRVMPSATERREGCRWQHNSQLTTLCCCCCCCCCAGVWFESSFDQATTDFKLLL